MALPQKTFKHDCQVTDTIAKEIMSLEALNSVFSLELAKQTRLTGQKAPVNHLSRPPQSPEYKHGPPYPSFCPHRLMDSVNYPLDTIQNHLEGHLSDRLSRLYWPVSRYVRDRPDYTLSGKTTTVGGIIPQAWILDCRTLDEGHWRK